MLGISDLGVFCAAIHPSWALPGPGTVALLGATAKGRLHLARGLDRRSGPFLIGFGIRLGTP